MIFELSKAILELKIVGFSREYDPLNKTDCCKDVNDDDDWVGCKLNLWQTKLWYNIKKNENKNFYQDKEIVESIA